MRITKAPFECSPRDVFLSRTDVISRYGWGRTKGYQMLHSPGFPGDCGGRWSLMALLAWEEMSSAPLPSTAIPVITFPTPQRNRKEASS